MKTTLYVTYIKHPWEDEPTPNYWDSWDAKRANNFKGHVFAGTCETDIPPPPPAAEIIKAQVAGLRAEQGRFQEKINAIEEQISKLLCIEDKSQESAP